MEYNQLQHSMAHLEAEAQRERAAQQACPHPLESTGMDESGGLHCKACGMVFGDEDWAERTLAVMRGAEGRRYVERLRRAEE